MAESSPFARDAIEIGCQDGRMAVRPDTVAALLVGHQEEDVRPLRTCSGASRAKAGCGPEMEETPSRNR